MTRKDAPVIKLIALSLFGALLVANGAAHADPATLRIGVNFERTGSIASYGQHALISAQIAVGEINKAGGINGAPIELVIEDNKSSPEQSVIATRNLADAGVFAMLGPVTTTVVRTAFPATNRAEMPAISPGSGAPGLGAQNRPWGFRDAAIDQLIIGDVVHRLHEAYPNAKKVVFALDPKDPYEVFLIRNVAPAALAENGMVVANKDALIEIPVDVTDFSVFVTRIKALEPDVVLTGMAHEALAGFLKEANRQHLAVPMFAGLGSITDAVADAAQGIHVFAGQPFDPSSDDAKVVAYVKAFKAQSEKELPGQYSNPIYADAGAYEGVYMFAAAMQAGKVTPSTPVKEARTRIRDYLTGLKGFPGLGNSIDINKDGDAIKKTIVFATQDGHWVRQ
jgi:branched-chain amino acid transport system substrate-binding protein